MNPALASLHAAIEGTVRAFRLGMQASGNDGLASVLRSLQRTMQDARAPLPAEPLVPLLRELAAARDRGDYLHVADLLAFKISPLLHTHAAAGVRPDA